MMSLQQIRSFYPEAMSGSGIFQRHILKEYVQLLVLDYLSSTKHLRKITFIGGSNLRLLKGIDRFSEDLDFDCKNLSENEFIEMSDEIVAFLRHNGFNVEIGGREGSGRLKAFRRSIRFPGLLFNLGLSAHREERFMIKVEAQDQGPTYAPTMEYVKGCGMFFAFPSPPEAVLCSMKIAAMLARAKGRDFYDVMFLFSRTKPDYSFLEVRCGIRNLKELKASSEKLLLSIDLKHKQRDFEHLLFNHENSRRILAFPEFIRAL